MKSIIKVEKLEFYYKEKRVLKDININFYENEIIGITGKNGSGKSTLAKILAGLERPHSGGVFFDSLDYSEKNMSYIRQNLSMVFQNPNNQIIANKVIDDMAFGLENLGIEKDFIKAKIDEISNKLGIKDLLEKNPEELSGGQKQIVAIAGVLLFSPKVIILDEINSMLDISSKKRIMAIIKELKKNHTIILISHDSRELSLTDRIIIMNKGAIEEDLKPQELFESDTLLKKYHLEKPFEYELLKRIGREKYNELRKKLGN